MSNLSAMIQDLIHGRQEQAEVALRAHIVTKSQTLLGESTAPSAAPAEILDDIKTIDGYKNRIYMLSTAKK